MLQLCTTLMTKAIRTYGVLNRKLLLSKLFLFFAWSYALLLVDLISWVRGIFPVPPADIFCWTDSVNVFHQIKTLPCKLKVFESHRVAHIISILPNVSWNYVKSAENPADCATRGLSASDLMDFKLWWHAPRWVGNRKSWPENPANKTLMTSEVAREQVASSSTVTLVNSSFSNSSPETCRESLDLPSLYTLVTVVSRGLRND